MPWSIAVMVIVIVVVTTIGRIVKAHYNAIGRVRQGAVEGSDQIRADQEIRQLKERIAVLERVVTDNHGSIGLDREIERLRDR